MNERINKNAADQSKGDTKISNNKTRLIVVGDFNDVSGELAKGNSNSKATQQKFSQKEQTPIGNELEDEFLIENPIRSVSFFNRLAEISNSSSR